MLLFAHHRAEGRERIYCICTCWTQVRRCWLRVVPAQALTPDVSNNNNTPVPPAAERDMTASQI